MTEGPDWRSERERWVGEVTQLRDGEVRVYWHWTFIYSSWRAYSEEKREVMPKSQLEEVLEQEERNQEEQKNQSEC